jgi:hypothetical protein
MPKKELIGVLSGALQSGQSARWTIHRTEPAARALLFIDDGDDITLGPEHPQ